MFASRAADAAEVMRRRLPVWLVPLVVRVRFPLAWSRASVRRDARDQMNLLLGASRPGVDLRPHARAYVLSQIRRGEHRWHPELVVRQRMVDMHNLSEARQLGRGVVVSLLHHGAYDGVAASVVNAGEPCAFMGFPYIFSDSAPRWVKQHVRLSSDFGVDVVDSSIGTSGVVELLQAETSLLIASDVPGSSRVSFVGRDVLGSSGAAYAASARNSPVVLLTSEVDAKGPFVRVHPPLFPADFADPKQLLAEMLARHEAVILQHPERYDLPLSRWGIPDPVPQRDSA